MKNVKQINKKTIMKSMQIIMHIIRSILLGILIIRKSKTVKTSIIISITHQRHTRRNHKHNKHNNTNNKHNNRQ